MKKTKIGQELIEGVNEAIAYERGRITLRSNTVEIPDEPSPWSKKEISQLRVKKLKVSQPILAAYLGVSSAALRAWEQGLKSPSGSARRLLEILDRAPREVIALILGEYSATRGKTS